MGHDSFLLGGHRDRENREETSEEFLLWMCSLPLFLNEHFPFCSFALMQSFRIRLFSETNPVSFFLKRNSAVNVISDVILKESNGYFIFKLLHHFLYSIIKWAPFLLRVWIWSPFYSSIDDVFVQALQRQSFRLASPRWSPHSGFSIVSLNSFGVILGVWKATHKHRDFGFSRPSLPDILIFDIYDILGLTLN